MNMVPDRAAIEALDIRPDLRESIFELLSLMTFHAQQAQNYLTIADDRALGYSMRHVINYATAASNQWMALREQATKIAVARHEKAFTTEETSAEIAA